MYSRKSSFGKHFDFYLVDTISLIVSFVFAYIIRANSKGFLSSHSYTDILLWMIVPNTLYFFLFNPYKDVLKRSNLNEIKLSITHTVINMLFIVTVIYALQQGNMYSRIILGITYVFYLGLSFFSRIIWKRVVSKNLSNAYGKESMLIIADKYSIEDILYNLNNYDFLRYSIAGIYIVNNKENYKHKKYKVLKKDENIYDYVIKNNINTLFVTTQLGKNENKIIKTLVEEGIEVQLYINSIFNVEAEDKEIGNVAMYNTLQLNSYYFTDSQRIYFLFKRFLDILFSLLGCMLLIPSYLLIKTCYLLENDKTPIIYTQRRVGLDGKEFELYKFRSMVPNADDVLKELLKNKKYKKQWDKNQKLDDDPRITKIGRFIRKTSMDELPQFINVLKGDMSIIGPRPLVPGELKSKNGIKLYERVKPGITGWWACNGRSDMSYEERLEHEYYYVKNCSLYLDILCVFRTIYVVVFGKGAK